MNPYDDHSPFWDAVVFLAIIIFVLFCGTVWAVPQ